MRLPFSNRLATRTAALLAASLWAAAGSAQTPAPVQPERAKEITAIYASTPFAKAAKVFEAEHDRWVAETIQIAETPSPPFKEKVRAELFAKMLQQAGIPSVETDPEGNVLGIRRGTGAPGGPLIVFSAHMDTVFPEGTDVKTRRDGDKLYGPGVGDDSSGLALLLATVRAMDAAGIKTKHDIMFMGTVGEEGLGDLRGVRYLLGKGAYKDRIKAFFSMDGGVAAGVTTVGAGSKRYKLTLTGPGGHSYGAFGIVSPAGALGSVLSNFYKMQVPADPKTTFSVGRVGGGTSVNAIPREVWAEFDMRSVSMAELDKMDQQLKGFVEQAVRDENAARSTKEGPVKADLKLIGDRPGGQTALSVPLAQYVTAAIQQKGLEVKYQNASTDSNIAMSLGIPAITMARVDGGYRGHSIDEWINVEAKGNIRVKEIALATLLAISNAP